MKTKMMTELKWQVAKRGLPIVGVTLNWLSLKTTKGETDFVVDPYKFRVRTPSFSVFTIAI